MTGLNMTYWWLCLQMCLGIFWHQLPTISAQIPSNACPQYFEYLQNNGAYIGRVTLPGQAARTTVLELQFSQREPLNGQLGKLELFNDRQRTQEDIRQGKPLTYRVHFPYPNILPKITLITVNGQVICAGQAYPAPSSVVNMRNTLTLSESIVYDSRPLSNPVQTFQTSFPNIDDTFFQPQNEPPTFDEFFTQAGQRFNPVQSPPQTFTRPVQQQSPQQTFRRPVQQSTPQRFVTTQPSRQPEPQYTQYEETPAPATPPRRAPQPTVSTASTAQSVQSSCGRRTSSFTPFIHHGTSLSPGQIPWLTAVYRKTTNGGVNFLCGGSLVSARTVITAAHCFRIWRLTKDDVVLHIGRHNLNDYRSKFAIRQVENVIIHQDYNASKMADADIAIMHFTEPVSFNELISPICLWNGPNDVAQIVGQKGYVAGWGADENGNPVTSIPKMVNADIVDEDTCVRNKEGFLSLVTARTLCAGNLDRSGPCSGDSGGGLMMQRDGRWLLRGIVSAGNTVDGMCNLNTYVLYCDLAKHMTWVQQNVIY